MANTLIVLFELTALFLDKVQRAENYVQPENVAEKSNQPEN
jgi:hypothetical protein